MMVLTLDFFHLKILIPLLMFIWSGKEILASLVLNISLEIILQYCWQSWWFVPVRCHFIESHLRRFDKRIHFSCLKSFYAGIGAMNRKPNHSAKVFYSYGFERQCSLFTFSLHNEAHVHGYRQYSTVYNSLAGNKTVWTNRTKHLNLLT